MRWLLRLLGHKSAATVQKEMREHAALLAQQHGNAAAHHQELAAVYRKVAEALA